MGREKGVLGGYEGEGGGGGRRGGGGWVGGGGGGGGGGATTHPHLWVLTLAGTIHHFRVVLSRAKRGKGGRPGNEANQTYSDV